MDLTMLVVSYIIGTIVTLVALYWVIRSAVLAALRAHVTSSTTGVSVVSANPLPVRIVEDDQPSSS